MSLTSLNFIGVVITVSMGGSMTSSLLKTSYIPKVITLRPGGIFKVPSILTWECHKSHTDSGVVAALNVQKVKPGLIPPGMTPLLQPLDVCINKVNPKNPVC